MWDLLPAVDAPKHLAIWVEQGCWGCDGPTTHVERSLGAAVATLLPRLEKGNTYYSSLLLGPGGDIGHATICSRGYCGGVGQISPDAQTTLLRTTDGGVTWQALATEDGAVRVAGSSALGPVLARTTFDGAGGHTTTYRILNGPEVKPPAAGAVLVEDQQAPLLLWRASDGLTFLGSDNVVVFRADRPASGTASYRVLATTPDLKRLLVAEYPGSGGGRAKYLLVRDGVVERTIATPPDGMQIIVAVWLDDRTLVATVGPGNGDPNVVALLDLESLRITPLKGNASLNPAGGARRLVAAAAKGPFVTVATPGDCLNVRETPAASAASYGCFKDGVIFAVRVAAASEGWVAVTAPDGRPGWVSAQFVTR